MNRTTFLAATGSAIAANALPHAASADAVDIKLATSTGSIFGSLTLPSAKPPYPVVLIIPGSGAVNRAGNDGGALRSNAYYLLAGALAKNGVASVSYDKRGIGLSAPAAPPESDLRLGTYVDDAAGWVNLLRADERFSSVTVAGHSEGALIGTLVAQTAPLHALVLLEGAGRPGAVVLREQLKPRLPPALYARADAVIAQLQDGHLVPNPPLELAGLFRRSVQPYVISWFKYDPAAELAKVRVPVTIVQGTADVQVTMADANALKRADPGAKLIAIDGMNHMLKYAPDHSSMQAILKGYEDPSLPVDPKVVAAVAAAAR